MSKIEDFYQLRDQYREMFSDDADEELWKVKEETFCEMSWQLPSENLWLKCSRFLRHSQIFEQLFVLINTKEVFWNIQALKYR